MSLVERIRYFLDKPDKSLVKSVENEFRLFINSSNPKFDIYPDVFTIRNLYLIYDRIIFNNEISKMTDLSFEISFKLTKSAGMTKFYHRSKNIKILFSYPLIFSQFKDNAVSYEVNGILCNNPVEALMRVMEHELVHVVEYLIFKDSSCSKTRFKKLCYHIFGHTDTKHKLGLNKENKAVIPKFKVGEKVQFEYNGITYFGIINRITKRATILINDKENKVNGKFYVPLTLLTKC